MTLPISETYSFVIPAKAGIHGLTVRYGRQFRPWIPDQVGNDKLWVCGVACGVSA
ncbi:MAG: hypothetical protein ACKVOS_05985 [Sphingorhabdus sp.]|uniref:hypothetical protein n=1 Tax=Sphingorhabdus sp. TaxID=1902408 RepID=UPI0038FC3D2E